MNAPNPNYTFPLFHSDRLCFLKNIITNPLITVGDYTYYDDFENVHNFERNVRYHFDFSTDRLIIGKFCMIASGVEFIMNGANHLTDAISTYPFAIFGEAWTDAMAGKEYPQKGDITIGNDVWIGYQATLMAGIKVGDGAIIATKSVVTRDVPPYTIVGGNPAQVIRKRFSEEQTALLMRLQWWDWEVEKITQHIQKLTSADIEGLAQLI